jgi:hypothetical protein
VVPKIAFYALITIQLKGAVCVQIDSLGKSGLRMRGF